MSKCSDPGDSSWLYRVERWFAELSTKRLRRGVHSSAAALEADIHDRIATRNSNPKPYVWTRAETRSSNASTDS